LPIEDADNPKLGGEKKGYQHFLSSLICMGEKA